MPCFLRLVGLAAMTFATACGDRKDRGSADAGDTADSALTRAPAPALASGGTASTIDTIRSGPVPVSITVTAGGKEYRVSGSGECQHTETASIYGVPAAMWSVQYGDAAAPVKNFSLTVWRPKADGADQLSLYLATGSANHIISTVKGAKLVGAGTVTVQSRNSGGRFEIDGQSGEGSRIRATVDCERFTEPRPVAG